MSRKPVLVIALTCFLFACKNSGADSFFAIEHNTTKFYRVFPDFGTWQHVGNTCAEKGGHVALDYSAGILWTKGLWTVGQIKTSGLWYAMRLDPCTGQCVETVELEECVGAETIAFHPVTGALYAIGGRKLLEINPDGRVYDRCMELDGAIPEGNTIEASDFTSDGILHALFMVSSDPPVKMIHIPIDSSGDCILDDIELCDVPGLVDPRAMDIDSTETPTILDKHEPGFFNLADLVDPCGVEPLAPSELQLWGPLASVPASSDSCDCACDPPDCEDSNECTVDRCDPCDQQAGPDGCGHEYQQQLFADICESYCPPDAPQPNLDDILCVLDDFADGAAVDGCTCEGFRDTTDLHPCPEDGGGDGSIGLDDILYMLDAFAGNPPCADPCP